MGKSAKVLGLDCGVSAQVMNHALLENGLLFGEPGNYVLTEEGAKYATLEAKFYNEHCAPYYSWDDSVLNILNMEERRKEYINSCREANRERRLRAEAVQRDSELLTDYDFADDIRNNTFQGAEIVSAIAGGVVIAVLLAVCKARNKKKEERLIKIERDK